jgi:hypothetical protein
MTSFANPIVRRLRYGRPIVVVSGLPRSGTSLAMQMLDAGGVPILTDAVRTADQSNPKGYYELEAVKDLHRQGDTSWLADARGKAVKIVSFLLTWLPETYDYKVVFMLRDLDEVIASQATMLRARGESEDSSQSDGSTRRTYEDHLEQVFRLLARRSCFSRLSVEYRDVLEQPLEQARRIADFVGMRVNVDAMARVADRSLYRSRKTSPG